MKFKVLVEKKLKEEVDERGDDNISSWGLSQEDEDVLYSYMNTDPTINIFKKGDVYTISDWYDDFKIRGADNLVRLVKLTLNNWVESDPETFDNLKYDDSVEDFTDEEWKNAVVED